MSGLISHTVYVWSSIYFRAAVSQPVVAVVVDDFFPRKKNPFLVIIETIDRCAVTSVATDAVVTVYTC